MPNKTSRIFIAALTAAVFTAGSAFAQQDPNKALIDLLVKKGVLTQQDVADLRAELAAQAQAAPAPAVAPESTTTTTTSTTTNAVVVSPATSAVPGYSGAASAGVPVSGSPASPLSFRIGIADFTPFGFMDFTGVYRNENTGGAIGSSFGSVPFANGSTGQLSETKFSAQNSRLGLRIDSNVGDTKVLGYVETDFLGNAAANLYVTSNADTLRMRNYFVDLRNGPFEFLAGQDWSLLTPNRVGLSPIPSDIFYSNDMDTNYQAGLTWARQPQVRFTYHVTNEFALAVSVEDPDQYVGSAVVLPAAFSAGEVDTTAASTQPDVFPDVIGKAAYDTTAVTGLPWHFEVGGLLSSFKVNTYSATLNSNETEEGGGVTGGVDLELLKGLNFIGTGFYSYGGGRYIQGLAPDFIIKAPIDGSYSIGLVKASSAILGLEYKVVPNDTVSAYWSRIDIGQRYNQLTTGAYVGYGYPGSANSDNKSIEELTLANTFTFWKNPAYGALQLIGQVSYVSRDPWYVAKGQPSEAQMTMVFLDLRYVLP
jgi:hypothetical protein